MRLLVLLLLPAIFGMVYCKRSGEKHYNPLRGPLVRQNHGAVGDVLGAARGVKQGGSSGQGYDYNLYDGPPQAGNGPNVRQQHGYNGAPQVAFGNGGSSNGNDAAVQGAVAPQGGQANTGGSSTDDGTGTGGRFGAGNPQIIPSGGDSGDYDAGQVYGGTGGRQGTNHGVYGGVGAAGAGDDSNSIDPAVGGNTYSGGNNNAGRNGAAPEAPNAAPVAGGGDVGLALAHEDLKASSSMSGGAVAGIVLGVMAVGAVGTGVAVVLLKSGA